MFNPTQPSIAVAYVLDSDGRILISWSDKWRSFSLPMSKVDLDVPFESPAEAAVRAASEVLHLPCQPVKDKIIGFFRYLQRSPRDNEIKDYQFNVVQVEVHSDFKPLGNVGLWVPIDRLHQGHYQPISNSVEQILNNCAEWGWI